LIRANPPDPRHPRSIRSNQEEIKMGTEPLRTFQVDRLPVAVLSLYNYVNPVVAVILGWLFYREPFGWREAGAMLVIFTGVAIVKRVQDSR
jgi:EamA domain-containing membrane protein RarD